MIPPLLFLFFFSGSGAVSPPPPPPPPPPPLATAVGTPAPVFDIWEALNEACPGVDRTRDIESAVIIAYNAGGNQPMSSAQILAIVLPLLPIDGNAAGGTPVVGAALPTFPTSMKRFLDSNPDPLDGWAIDNPRGSFA